MKSKSMHPWIQPILVLKTGEHTATIATVALASLQVADTLTVGSENTFRVEQWLSGPFTKTVRRGSASDLAKVETWAREEGEEFAAVALGSSRAVALMPMELSSVPRVVEKLQVSGTDFPREELAKTAPHLTIYVLETLTTGKASAQAAHALWLWWLRATEVQKAAWVGADRSLDVSLCSAEALEGLAVLHPLLAIRDAGHTEIAAQTLTALALEV